jgi:DNA-binding XRE family transcriptional regulator
MGRNSVELTYGERQALKQARIEAGYTQGELAAEIGLASNTISNYETGQGPVMDGALRRFEELLPEFEGPHR